MAHLRAAGLTIQADDHGVIKNPNITYIMGAVRRAILIKGPGESDALDCGGEQDILNMKRFLLSAASGSWKEQEICVLMNPSKDRLLREVRRTIADYSLTYFSGHGCMNQADSWLSINGREVIPEQFLLNNSPRQLIIGDHCRERLPARMGGIPEEPAEILQGAEWQKARSILDQAILRSPVGTTFVWAASVGQKAWGDSGGGAFTGELLDLIHRWYNAEPLAPIYIEQLIPHIDKALGGGGKYAQNPELFTYHGGLQVPFALTMPRAFDNHWPSPEFPRESKSAGLNPGHWENTSVLRDDHRKALILSLGVVGALLLMDRGR